jgi:hypothetical protein
MAQTRTLHGWLDAHPRSISLIGGIALFVLTLPAQAVLLIGNSPAGNAHNDVFSTQWNAVQFTQGQSRLHAQLYRLRAHNGGDGVGGLELELYDATGTSGTAGSSIASLVTNDPVTNSYTNITFSSNK